MIDRDIEVARSGMRWLLNPADYGHHTLFWLGTKDAWDIRELRRLVRPGHVILDAGANFGYYALSLASALGGRCRVFALEPNPVNFDRLSRHIAMNGFEGVIQAHCIGLSDQPDVVSMSQLAGNAGHTSITPGGEISGVRLTTLDDFSESAQLDRLDLVVLDVEGLEERALKGALRSLERFRPIVFVELFPPVMKRQGSSPAAAAQILLDQGYELFLAGRDRLMPLTRFPEGDQRINAFGFPRENVPQSASRTGQRS